MQYFASRRPRQSPPVNDETQNTASLRRCDALPTNVNSFLGRVRNFDFCVMLSCLEHDGNGVFVNPQTRS